MTEMNPAVEAIQPLIDRLNAAISRLEAVGKPAPTRGYASVFLIDLLRAHHMMVIASPGQGYCWIRYHAETDDIIERGPFISTIDDAYKLAVNQIWSQIVPAETQFGPANGEQV
ncbi:MAG: hypothetical protein K8L99_15125 [Anaerolineae bacterium]|nr:hypothetical protein [Anaerolineae bacterium]